MINNEYKSWPPLQPCQAAAQKRQGSSDGLGFAPDLT